MATRVFDTYHAPQEEIDGVKEALTIANIHFYETHKGKWGIGSAAIWIEDETEYPRAREVVEMFEEEWKTTVRLESSSEKINWKTIPIAAVIILVVLYFNFSWLY